MCTDPKLRSRLMRELRDELAARRAANAGNGHAQRGTGVARAIRFAAPAVALLILAGVLQAV